MEGIGKYSKEWFALNGTDASFEAAKALEGGETFDSRRASDVSNIFTGTLDEVNEKISAKSEDRRGRSSINAITGTFGAENIFNVLDADGNGTVTEEEIQAVARLSTSEFAEEDDTRLTGDDLRILYRNAMAAVDATYEEDDNTTNITYRDGSTSSLVFDDAGGILERTDITTAEDGSKTEKTVDYQNQSTLTSTYDMFGRETGRVNDLQGTINDTTLTTEYSDAGKTETYETIGRTVTTSYDAEGNKTESKSTYNYDINGEIESTSQGGIGDCWLLAGVNALSYSTKGQQILKDAIHQNDDGSITVKLRGVNREYTYTPEQIAAKQYGDGSKKLADGDDDMNVLEMAFADYRRENIENNESTIIPFDRAHNKSIGTTAEDPLHNGMTDEAVYILTGTDSQYWLDPRIINTDKYANNILDKFSQSPDDYSLVCSFKAEDESVTEGTITNSHVYSIKSVDEDNVYVVNPWHADKTIAYPRDRFMENVNDLALTDLVEATTTEQLDSEKWDNKLSEQIIHTLGPVDTFLRPKVESLIETGKKVYETVKEKVTGAWNTFKSWFGG